MRSRFIIWVYLAVGAVNVTSMALGSEGFEEYTKPLLMPLLIFYIYRYSEGFITLPRLLLVVALILSWIGDMLLMNEGTSFFLGGLVAFLVTQLIYVRVFYLSVNGRIQWKFVPAIPFILYALLMLTFLLPGSGLMGIAILIYALGITMMAITARHRKGLTEWNSYRMVMAGALFFVLSDSIIAFNKFYAVIPYAGMWIMLTYVLAQVLIVRGILAGSGELG